VSLALLLALGLAIDPCLLDDPTVQDAGAPVATAPAPPPTPLPGYPLGPRPVPDFLAPGDPFTLSDLRYSMVDSGRAEQAFAARVRYKNLGYLGAEFQGDRQGMSLMTHRLSADVSTENGDWILGAGFRTRRFDFSAEARYSGEPDSRHWRLGPTIRFRLTPDLELHGFAAADTSRPEDRLLTRLGGGALWQRGAWLEAGVEYARAYELTDAGSENQVDSGRVFAVAQLGRAEVAADGRLVDTQGRFPRTDGDTTARLRMPVTTRLLLEGHATGRFEDRAGALGHEFGGRLTWLGRRYTLPRAGLVGQGALALARKATEAGEYELRRFDEDELRAQRERLSLSPRAVEFQDDMEAVYRAETQERLVPLLGVELRQRVDVFNGEHGVAARALVGVPWPLARPWHASEASVPFLRLEGEHERVTTASSLESSIDRAWLTVSLDREMDLVVAYVRAEPTALEVIRGIGLTKTFAVSLVYARGH
jgi:hypothetical protein